MRTSTPLRCTDNALGQTEEAIELVQRSVTLLQQYHLPQDASRATLAQHWAFLAQLQQAADRRQH